MSSMPVVLDCTAAAACHLNMNTYEYVLWTHMNMYYEHIWICTMNTYEYVLWIHMNMYHEYIWICTMNTYEYGIWISDNRFINSIKKITNNI